MFDFLYAVEDILNNVSTVFVHTTEDNGVQKNIGWNIHLNFKESAEYNI